MVKTGVPLKWVFQSLINNINNVIQYNYWCVPAEILYYCIVVMVQILVFIV